MSHSIRAMLAIFAGLVALVLAPRDASAYPWMIRHDYTACAQCHADPSGGSLLTPYGRAQSEILLRTYYGEGDPTERDPGTLGDFMFGAFKLPEPLLVQSDVRNLLLHVSPGGAPSDTRFVQMQADVVAQLTTGPLRQNVSVGYVHRGAPTTWLAGGDEEHHLVSRHHWLGLAFGKDDELLLRAGRMNLPFGLRSLEHTSWVRSLTGTDINAAQQHGVALAYGGEKLRAEVMAIAGNFQVSPDTFRERGYSAYAELAPSPKIAVGVSSLVTHAGTGLRTGKPLFRQAHGAFVRFVPTRKLVLSGEVDVLGASAPRERIQVGLVSMLSADLEPLQGVHFTTMLEASTTSFRDASASFGIWGGAAWFFLPHADVRVDLVYRDEDVGASRATSTALLTQLHLFL